MQGELLGPKRERDGSRIPFLPAHSFTNYIQVTSARAGSAPGRELSPAGKAAHLRAGGKGDACGGTRRAWSAASSLLKRSQLVPEKVQGKKEKKQQKKTPNNLCQGGDMEQIQG